MDRTDPTAVLGELASGWGAGDAGAELAMLSEAVALINMRMAKGGEPDERVRKWIKKLYEAAKTVAGRHDALSFSITVGLPVGVSVTVTWQPD